MLEWTTDNFCKMLRKNGYHLKKKGGKGSHSVYVNEAGNIISVPLRIRCVIARRLIKENNLNIDL